MRKALWVTTLTDPDAKMLIAHANASGATLVCIRSTNSILPQALPKLRAAKLDVYSWRWPAVESSPGDHAPHHYAMDEASYVAETLIPAGLDGYIVDPESDGAGQVDDWNSATHRQLAVDFCAAIRKAADKRGAPFHFGVTSGCQYPTNHVDIPWAAFVAAADALYPQIYWRDNIKGVCTPVNGKSPQAAYKLGMTSWAKIANGKPLIAIAGEIDCIGKEQVDELSTFAALIAGNQSEAHFYADSAATAPEIHAAIKAM